MLSSYKYYYIDHTDNPPPARAFLVLSILLGLKMRFGPLKQREFLCVCVCVLWSSIRYSLALGGLIKLQTIFFGAALHTYALPLWKLIKGLNLWVGCTFWKQTKVRLFPFLFCFFFKSNACVCVCEWILTYLDLNYMWYMLLKFSDMVTNLD